MAGKEGSFDSSHITMKRWGEWEKERRQKAAILAGLPAPQFLVSDSGEDWMSHQGLREEELSDESSSSRQTGDSSLPFASRHNMHSGSSVSTGHYSLTDNHSHHGIYNPASGPYPPAPVIDSIPLLNMQGTTPPGTIGRSYQLQQQSQQLSSQPPQMQQRTSTAPMTLTPNNNSNLSTSPFPSRTYTASPSSNLAHSSYTPSPEPPGGPRLVSIDTRPPPSTSS